IGGAARQREYQQRGRACGKPQITGRHTHYRSPQDPIVLGRDGERKAHGTRNADFRLSDAAALPAHKCRSTPSSFRLCLIWYRSIAAELWALGPGSSELEGRATAVAAVFAFGGGTVAGRSLLLARVGDGRALDDAQSTDHLRIVEIVVRFQAHGM